MPEHRSPADLLVEALEHLPADERKRVTAWVLGGVTTTRPAEQPLLFDGTSLKGDHQVVPVRLPAELHERLRGWCAEHGFAMATVIRGLLSRFLADQDG